jgi:CrcB protein
VHFPWAVLVVNAVGSAIGGVVLGLSTGFGLSSDIRLVLLTGLCGGLTTFSTWTVETLQLVAEAKMRAAILSVASNLAVGIGAAALGFAITLALI